MKRVSILLVSLLALAGCGQEMAFFEKGQSNPSTVLEYAPVPPEDATFAMSGSVIKGASQDPSAGGVDQKIIRASNLSVEVSKKKFRSAVAKVRAVSEKFEGHVSDSSVETVSDDATRGSLTIRIPSASYAEALADIRKIGDVKNESETGQDVTDQFVDLEARLRNARATEATYLKLMGEAKNVGEVVQVQEKLSAVQLEIEQLQGRLNQVNDRISLASVTVNIFEPGAASFRDVGPVRSAVRMSLEAAKFTMAALIVLPGVAIPLLIVIVPLYYGIRTIRRRRRARKAGSVN